MCMSLITLVALDRFRSVSSLVLSIFLYPSTSNQRLLWKLGRPFVDRNPAQRLCGVPFPVNATQCPEEYIYFMCWSIRYPCSRYACSRLRLSPSRGIISCILAVYIYACMMTLLASILNISYSVVTPFLTGHPISLRQTWL